MKIITRNKLKRVFTLTVLVIVLFSGATVFSAPVKKSDGFNHRTCFGTVMGVVQNVSEKDETITLKSRNGDLTTVHLGVNTVFEVLRNLDNLVADVLVPKDNAGRIREYVKPGQLLVVQGIQQVSGQIDRFDVRQVYLTSRTPGNFVFEDDGNWWIKQISNLANEWLDDLFGEGRSYAPDHFASSYRTNLNFLGKATDDGIQECATLSRLVYGLSSAYLMTGNERYFMAARAGVEYQRQTFRILSHDGKHCFWAYGFRKFSHNSRLIIPSQNKDDLGSLPIYEQIYALAGLTQYYRISLDPSVLEDIRLTMNTFEDYYRDPALGGYYSHIADHSLRYDDPSLGSNQSRKNWNSIGDHLPAYLINLVLALDPVPQGRSDLGDFRDLCLRMLDETTSTIAGKFPDPDPSIPYVRERFHSDWTPDFKWGWQKDRGIIGHNLKIAWNLIRVANHYLNIPAKRQEAFKLFEVARKLCVNMAVYGLDRFHGGVFDIVERHPENGLPIDFPWSNTKEFWQQEQGILAYLIMHGARDLAKSPSDDWLPIAREISTFWNLFFLDRDNAGVIFRVNDMGVPVLQGDYNKKGGHAISGYHAFELNYLAHIYIRSYVKHDNGSGRSFCLYFRPTNECAQKSINVLPDFFRPGALEIVDVTVNGVSRDTKSIRDFQIPLDSADFGKTLRVTFRASKL